MIDVYEFVQLKRSKKRVHAKMEHFSHAIRLKRRASVLPETQLQLREQKTTGIA